MTDVKSEYYLDQTTGQRYMVSKLGGTPANDGSDGGLVIMRPGVANQLNNRYIEPDASGAIGGINTVTYTEAENVRNITMSAYTDAAITSLQDYLVHVWCVFDAPDDATAAAWIALAKSGSASTNVFAIPYGQRVEFNGSSYFSRIDFDMSVNGKIFIEGN